MSKLANIFCLQLCIRGLLSGQSNKETTVHVCMCVVTVGRVEGIATACLFFRLEDQKEILSDQKQRAAQRAVPVELGESTPLPVYLVWIKVQREIFLFYSLIRICP